MTLCLAQKSTAEATGKAGYDRRQAIQRILPVMPLVIIETRIGRI